MPRTEPFDEHLAEYEKWFEDNRFAYEAELEAVRRHLDVEKPARKAKQRGTSVDPARPARPARSRNRPGEAGGLEIGVGSGLFAAPLGIRHGVEPSERMRSKAVERGIEVVEGVAEDLPFDDASFDFALMVTTICFVDDPSRSVEEARRVVRPGGRIVLGLVDRESPVGKLYEKHRHKSVFYRDATFFTAGEVTKLMEDAGLFDFRYTQTIFRPLREITGPEEVRDGRGDGSFVVVSGIRPSAPSGRQHRRP